MKPTTKKLTLATQTIRSLTADKLGAVAGGSLTALTFGGGITPVVHPSTQAPVTAQLYYSIYCG